MANDTVRVKPDPHCKYCHGEGVVYDSVDYGGTTVQMPSDCECILNQLEDPECEYEIDDTPEEKKMTLQEFLTDVLPLLFSHTVDRLDKYIDGVGQVKAYRVGAIIRIDIQVEE